MFHELCEGTVVANDFRLIVNLWLCFEFPMQDGIGLGYIQRNAEYGRSADERLWWNILPLSVDQEIERMQRRRANISDSDKRKQEGLITFPPNWLIENLHLLDVMAFRVSWFSSSCVHSFFGLWIGLRIIDVGLVNSSSRSTLQSPMC